MPHPALKSREQPLAFASFRLLRAQKILLENQLPVRIGSRALELLIALVERAGEVVGKNELIACVWPDTVVEENNLRVHISAIRKLLGDGDQGARFIINVAGRGYSFVAPVTRVEEAPSDVRAQVVPSAALPVALTRVVGRDAIVGSVAALLGLHRIVTLIGPGGIGKTTVSLAVADQQMGGAGTRVCFVDLAVVSDPQLVTVAIATAVGGPALMEDVVAALAAYLQPMQLLLIIDNCEHLVAAVAETVEKLLRAAPGLRILATSRERLQAEGEHAVPLAPLRCPDESTTLTVSAALQYSAIELFAERALAAHDAFAVTEQNVTTIAAICRRLDGIPLGLELAAARTGALGLDVLLRSLEQNLTVVSGGRRSVASRHQSLSATLQWSFRLLAPAEQVILRRLSTFRDLFSAQAAIAVAGDGMTGETVVAGLMSLVQRSLLVADTSGPNVRYRLLYVTRAFAAARLAETAEGSAVLRRHADYHCTALQEAERGWDTLTRAEWLTTLDVGMADLRSCLDWAFGPAGDEAIAARLFLASLPIGVHLSLGDFQPRALRILDVLQRQVPPDPAAELRVRTALSVMLMQTGAREDDLRAGIDRMAALAREVGVPKLLCEALCGYAVLALEAADYLGAVQHFELQEDIAKQADDPLAVLVADRLGAQVFHWAGDQRRARARAERVLRNPAAPVPVIYGQGPVDLRVSMRIVLARLAWLEGCADQAREIAASALEIAGSVAPVDVCQALSFASCPIALWRGDREEAQLLVRRLLDESRRHGFTRWYRLALCYQQSLDGHPHEDVAMPVSPLQQDLLSTIDMRWATADVLARASQGRAGWCNAELLRVAGERSRREAQPDARAIAELRFRTALEFARGQGTLAWELRAAVSLASLRVADGHRGEARETLESVCSRFTEGLRTVDYRAAMALMAAL
ncbi:MAG: winged helix-turn-helix domain-containing protein [Pseudomonadota bacterium]